MASYSTPPVIPLGTFGASTASASICSSVQNKLLAWQNTLQRAAFTCVSSTPGTGEELNKSQKGGTRGGAAHQK